MASRFWPTKDTELAKRFNDELVGNLKDGKDGIIGHEVILYRVSVYETKTNMYGEASDGKTYEAGVKLSCIVEADDINWNNDEFGADTRQEAQFHFQRDMLIDVNFRPDIGDVVSWNLGYFEITKTNENQLVGGMFDQNYSAVATAFLTRLSNIQVENMRAI